MLLKWKLRHGSLFPAHTDGQIFVPAGGDIVRVQRLALVGEVVDVEYRQRAVDVALHGVVGMVSIWVHRERPVVDQAWNHVWCKSNDHGLWRHQTTKSMYWKQKIDHYRYCHSSGNLHLLQQPRWRCLEELAARHLYPGPSLARCGETEWWFSKHQLESQTHC